MRSLLSAHPAIAIAPETHFLSKFAERYRTSDLNTPEEFDVFWSTFVRSGRFTDLGIDAAETQERILATGDLRFKNVFAVILQEYARAAGKQRWGEKTPAHEWHIDTLLKWFPDSRVIYMMRDPRAACASLIKTPWVGTPWVGKPTVHHDSLESGSAGRRELLNEVALFWQESVERFRRRWTLDDRATIVRYEDLVTNPEAAVRDTCRFVETEYHHQMLANRSTDDLPPARARWGDKTLEEWRHLHIEAARGEVSTESLDKWRMELIPQEMAIIQTNCRPGMLAFGYDPVATEG